MVCQVLKCQHSSGGFGGSERHDAHLLYTLSALQVLALYDKLHLVDADQIAKCEQCCSHCVAFAAVANCVNMLPFRYVQFVRYKPVPADIQGLQQADGSFTGDESGEIDTRCAFHWAPTSLNLRLSMSLVKVSLVTWPSYILGRSYMHVGNGHTHMWRNTNSMSISNNWRNSSSPPSSRDCPG